MQGAVMDDKLNSTDVEKRDDRSDKKLEFRNSQTTVSKWPVDSTAGQTGSLTEIDSSSEQISTELSSADISVKTFSHKTRKEDPVEHDMEDNFGRGSNTAVLIRSPHSVEKDQPTPLHTLLSSSVDTHTIPNVSRSFTSIRSQESIKTSAVHTEPDGEDLCAAILLACLFCHPLDFLLATMRGWSRCAWSLCSSLCGCERQTLQPLLDVTQNCDLCGCLGVRCILCDCNICDICLHAAECIDLGMEISQMLNH